MAASSRNETVECVYNGAGTLRRQVTKYLFVGGLAFIADYATLFALASMFGFHYLVAATGGFIVGLSVNYALSIHWVFEHRSIASKQREFAAFAAIGVVGLALNDALMYLATGLIGVHYMASKLIAAAFVLMFNFAMRRHFLFTQHAKAV